GPGMPRTTDCFSRSAQICSKVALSSQMPSHLAHSSSLTPPKVTAPIGTLQWGQLRAVSVSGAGCSTFAPQCEQNLEPSNTRPKHEGQAMVASRAPQWSHF